MKFRKQKLQNVWIGTGEITTSMIWLDPDGNYYVVSTTPNYEWHDCRADFDSAKDLALKFEAEAERKYLRDCLSQKKA